MPKVNDRLARQQVVDCGLVVESDTIGRRVVQLACRIVFGKIIECHGIVYPLPETEGTEQPFVASGSRLI